MEYSFKFNYIANNMTVWMGHCFRHGSETQPGEDFNGVPLTEFSKAGSGVFKGDKKSWTITPDRLEP